MRLLLSMMSIFVTCFYLSAQSTEWQWPSDPALKRAAKEKQAFYKVSMELDHWDNAYQALRWLYKNNPNLNSSIFIDGVKVIETLLKTDMPNERKMILQDSILLLYDLRASYFGNKAKVMERKAYSGFKMYYNKPAKYELLLQLYENAYELIGLNMSIFNLSPYMTLAKYYHQYDKEAMPRESVLDIYIRITDIIANRLEQNPADSKRLQKEIDKIDALLSSISGLLSCDYIAQFLVPKLENNPTDYNTAKKIFSYSLTAKCSNQPYFLQVAQVMFNEKPTYKLAMLMGDKYIVDNHAEQAIEHYEKAIELSDGSKEDIYPVFIAQAKAYSRIRNREKARTWAKKAIVMMPDLPDGYNIIGNLYFSSFEMCAKQKSQTKDRVLFIAAYQMYQKAGNQKQMDASKKQFPSKEEIFKEGYSKDDEISIDCWINEVVKIQTRD